MKKPVRTIIILLVVVIGFFVAGPLFIIDEGQQAVVVQMGRIVRVVTDAGLYVKVPFIDEVVRYPKRIMAWDGEARNMPTKERQFIFVDVTARWRISDPKIFYESINTVDAAYLKLAEILDSEVRTVVAENYLRESVRDTNFIIEGGGGDALGLGDSIESEIISATIQPDVDYEPITRGRRQLAEEVLARAQQMVPEYGIVLIDVITRQIRYSDELTPSVYARMIRERNQIAQAFRSEGEGRRAEWLGRMDNDKRSILSAAYNRSETIRGEADAIAARTYADAYNRERSFFDFWRAIESYRQTMPKFDKTLTTDMDYFRYLYSPRQ